LTVRVDVPEPPERLEVLREAMGPAGATVVLSVTVPAKLLFDVMVIVDVPELPAWIVNAAELLVMVKSGVPGAVTVTWTSTV
jgi:hypothetical protein